MTMDLHEVLRRHMTDLDSGWSIGSFGAIGEFHQRDNDILETDEPEQLLRVTEKGALRLDPQALAQSTPVAFETLSPRPERWGQGLALCLPADQAMGEKRAVLTELGPDDRALREAAKGDILFDMGLDQPQIDFCIRTGDPSLLKVLRAYAGRSLFEHDNPAMAAILKAHPTRVVISRLGRVEIYQKIGGPDTGGVSPDGPHTHVLPKLLRSGRTHSANTPIPDGLVPCAFLHPASPVMGTRGEDIDFKEDRFAAFQTILTAFGRSDYIEAKTQVLTALEEGTPDRLTEPGTRLGRVAFRNALRQQLRVAQAGANDERARLCRQLLQEFDRNAPDDDAETERPGHEGEPA